MLDVESNQLEQLPTDLSGLTSLQELNVQSNKLRTFPASIGYVCARACFIWSIYCPQCSEDIVYSLFAVLAAIPIAPTDFRGGDSKLIRMHLCCCLPRQDE